MREHHLGNVVPVTRLKKYSLPLLPSLYLTLLFDPCRCWGWHQYISDPCTWASGHWGAFDNKVAAEGRESHCFWLLRARQYEIPSWKSSSPSKKHQLSTDINGSCVMFMDAVTVSGLVWVRRWTFTCPVSVLWASRIHFCVVKVGTHQAVLCTRVLSFVPPVLCRYRCCKHYHLVMNLGACSTGERVLIFLHSAPKWGAFRVGSGSIYYASLPIPNISKLQTKRSLLALRKHWVEISASFGECHGSAVSVCLI